MLFLGLFSCCSRSASDERNRLVQGTALKYKGSMVNIQLFVPGQSAALVIARRKRSNPFFGGTGILPVIRHPGLGSEVQEMAGRDARRYQIVGTGVPAGAGFPPTRE